MKQRIDTEDNWKAKNPVLLNGELGLISGDPRYKIGNGTSPWNDLPFRGVGIEEYDNRTLVQADGLVDTDDVHYFLPNANPMDKKHTFAMLSDIPEGGEGGEGSPSAEEIYIGEEEPTDPNVKVWINPKEQGEGGGSAGGSGALRVWIAAGDAIIDEGKIAENVATYNAIQEGKPTSVVFAIEYEAGKGMYNVSMFETAEGVVNLLHSSRVFDGEAMLDTYILALLYPDGSTDMEITA